MSNIFSFFGQEIKTGAPQSFEIPFGEVVLHLSTVSLAKDTPKGSITRVYVHSVEEGEEGEEQKDNKYVICTLVGKEKESVTIDLNFSEDLALSLETTAGVDTTVHVTGYINLIGDEEEGELGYNVINTDGNESDEEVKTKLLQKMLEEEDDSEDEDFHPDLNESTESAKLEELSDEDDEEEIEDSVAEEVMRRVTQLEDKIGREATDNEIQAILAKVQKEASAPAKEEPKKQEKQAPPQKKQQQQQKQAPKKEESKKRKQEDAQVSNSQKKNKKNKKK